MLHLQFLTCLSILGSATQAVLCCNAASIDMVYDRHALLHIHVAWEEV